MKCEKCVSEWVPLEDFRLPGATERTSPDARCFRRFCHANGQVVLLVGVELTLASEDAFPISADNENG